jgi:hypothetical protein
MAFFRRRRARRRAYFALKVQKQPHNGIIFLFFERKGKKKRGAAKQKPLNLPFSPTFYLKSPASRRGRRAKERAKKQ